MLRGPEKTVGLSKQVVVPTAAILAVFCCHRAKGDLSITTASGSESAMVTDYYGNTNSAGGGSNAQSTASLTSEPPQEYGDPYAENDMMSVESDDSNTTSSSMVYEEGGTGSETQTDGTDQGTANTSVSFTDSTAQLFTLSGPLNVVDLDYDETPTINVTVELTESGQLNPVFQQSESASTPSDSIFTTVSFATVLQPGPTYTLSVSSSLYAPTGGADSSWTGFGITGAVSAVPEPSTLALAFAGTCLLVRRRRSH